MAQEWEPIVIGACGICGWKALTQGGLCIDCRDVREWSRVNRAFCRLIHRDRHAEAPADLERTLAPVA